MREVQNPVKRVEKSDFEISEEKGGFGKEKIFVSPTFDFHNLSTSQAVLIF